MEYFTRLFRSSHFTGWSSWTSFEVHSDPVATDGHVPEGAPCSMDFKLRRRGGKFLVFKGY